MGPVLDTTVPRPGELTRLDSDLFRFSEHDSFARRAAVGDLVKERALMIGSTPVRRAQRPSPNLTDQAATPQARPADVIGEPIMSEAEWVAMVYPEITRRIDGPQPPYTAQAGFRERCPG